MDSDGSPTHVTDTDYPHDPQSLSRRSFLLSALAVAPLGAVAAACTTTKEVTVNLESEGSAFGFRVVEFDTDDTVASGDANAELLDLASRVEDLPSLPTGDLAETTAVGPAPIGFRAPTIQIDESTIVVDVGLTDDGYFDVPAYDEIGWYRIGPEPGQPGSAVLAAHITLDRRDGAFRHLADFSAGDVVTVDFDDGSAVNFEVQALAQYDKDVLPLDRLFDRSGPARLVLITCGGVFNPQVGSFEDNLIVYATPAPDEGAG